MEFVDYRSTYEMLTKTVDRYQDQEAYRTILDPDRSESVTWNEFGSQVRDVGKSLIALGVESDDKVNIISYTCYRWMLSDMGTASIGACTVGIYHSNLAKDVGYIVDHSDAVLAFAEDESQLEKLVAIRDQIPDVRKVVLLKGDHPDDWVLTYEEFLELGRDVTDAQLDERIAAVKPTDIAAIVYTSGTTGVPKGAMLTHDNITFTAQSVLFSSDIHPGDVQLMFLPLAHVFARTCGFTAVIAGSTTVFARGLDTIAEDMKIAKPDWFASVPRIFEKVHTKILSGAEAKGGIALKLFRWACRTGDEMTELTLAGKPMPLGLKLRYGIASKLVFSKVLEALGGRLRWCISGAAPLNPSIGKFFHAAGVLILEGIGMTENTSFTNVNRVDGYRFGWVGPTGPGIEQKTADDQEILYRGRNVMKGYYKMPAETAETITEEGWQHTGDLGEIDEHGFLRVTGRKKDLIVTAGGKNIAPAPIEGTLATSTYIEHVCVIGDRRKYLVALATLDPETVPEYARENGIAFESLTDLLNESRIADLINAEVQSRNSQFASFETIKKVRLVENFSIENGFLTPTLKVKRNVVQELYRDLVDSMYAEG